jgi:histone H3/H4
MSKQVDKQSAEGTSRKRKKRTQKPTERTRDKNAPRAKKTSKSQRTTKMGREEKKPLKKQRYAKRTNQTKVPSSKTVVTVNKKRDRQGAMRMLALQNKTNADDQVVETKTRMTRRINNVAKNIDPRMKIGKSAIHSIGLAVSSFDAEVIKNASTFAIGAKRKTVNVNDILNSVASSQRMLEQIAPHTPRIYVDVNDYGEAKKRRTCVAK